MRESSVLYQYPTQLRFTRLVSTLVSANFIKMRCSGCESWWESQAKHLDASWPSPLKEASSVSRASFCTKLRTNRTHASIVRHIFAMISKRPYESEFQGTGMFT